jgi:hypothetical protein
MITEELRKYIDLVEEQDRNGLLHEMANVGPMRHGIDNVYIFVGSVEKSPHWLRVKVSNVPGKYERTDSFVIKMPSLDYDPTQVASWITPQIMSRILEWIKLNQEVLYSYETGKITDTDVFLNSLSKV